MTNKRLYLELFGIFLKIGTFGFGGAYGIIPLIENECVEKRNWITREELINIIAISESTPGPLAVKITAYVGYHRAKLIGALSATLGIALPAFILIYFISLYFTNLIEIPIINNAFKGIRIGISVLILSVSYKIFLILPKKVFSIILMICAFATLLLVNLLSIKFSTIYIILISAMIGYIYFILQNLKEREVK